ncbi:tetraspanin family domain-containing protein [Ditylenchus destructor]|uniref:Tetraspanin n=1 Tax=Ditylenchus destructor TaxID=166010 RepID=A0AAD4MTI2_9BILA|nr:tetraspanin family domain-containing protein [Ditylenchus destructor]
MASSGFGCLRWSVFVFNLIFWLSGLGIAGIGLWLRLDPSVNELAELSPNQSSSTSVHQWRHNFSLPSTLLVVAGALMTLIGFLGCCGAWRQNQCMLVGFFVLLIIVFCLEVTCAIVAYVHQDSIRRYIESSMYDIVREKYGDPTNPKYQQLFDRIQSEMECCGVRSYRDWLYSSWAHTASEKSIPKEIGIGTMAIGKVPTSCCNEEGLREYPANCGHDYSIITTEKLKSFFQGCSTALYHAAKDNLELVILTSVVLGSIQLVGIILSTLLCCCIGKREDEEWKSRKRDIKNQPFNYYHQ